MKFSEEFFWGAATASYQVEGGIENNDWAKAARDGRVPPAGKATDHYKKYVSDFAIAKSLGHNAHRISIEWSRIEPFEGKFDEAAIEHYRRVIAALRMLGMEPFVTIWHFTLPTWFSESGGWGRRDAVKIFARYASYVVLKLGRSVKYWITINEPLVYTSNGFLKGKWPPFKKNIFSFLHTTSVLQAAHRKVYHRIKTFYPDAEVGIAKHNIDFVGNGSFVTAVAAWFMRWFWNRRFLNATGGCHDFIGINYYFHKRFGEKKNTYPKSDLHWDIYPFGIYRVLKEAGRYKKPIYVLENGLADERDVLRPQFIRDHIREVMRARNDGVDIRGYFHWSLLDNFEWAEGYKARFGLVGVDYATGERQIRPSALVYKNIIEEHQHILSQKEEKEVIVMSRFQFRRILW